MMKFIRILFSNLVLAFALMGLAKPGWACGFYVVNAKQFSVANADTNLYNQVSQVIIARDGDRTILTMVKDYKGEAKDFALVVPVPVPITKDQVHLSNPKVIERLDKFSAPRLVEYFDSNPCYSRPSTSTAGSRAGGGGSNWERDASLRVTIEAKFAVGEYDILILSAQESDGLETWLLQNGYKIPPGASQLLKPYIRDKMKFFVAKVNLEEFQKSEFQSLHPLAIAYESPRFMYPLRLGTLNGQGEQDLIVYALSPQGQVELTNYRSVKIPSNIKLPEFVREEFGEFYKAMYTTAHERENRKVAFLEYAGDMVECDPCVVSPLTLEELKEAGVFWLNSEQRQPNFSARDVFITRLHVRYDRNTFPEDLRFQQTGNRENFQGLYTVRHSSKSVMDCPAAENYKQQLRERTEREAITLSQLTQWDLSEIRRKVELSIVEHPPWWRIFDN